MNKNAYLIPGDCIKTKFGRYFSVSSPNHPRDTVICTPLNRKQIRNIQLNELGKNAPDYKSHQIKYDDIEEVYLDFQDLKTNSETEDRTDVMLVAAKKDVVDGYLDMLNIVGLKTVVVDVDAFALENSYEANYGSEGTILLADIGSSKMNINIISDGTSIFARDIMMGSRQLTEDIQARFGLSFDEAESLKLGSVAPEDKQEELEEIFGNICTQWIMEIKKAVDFYNSNYPDKPIEKMVLGGGGAKVKGLDQFFSEETGFPVELSAPFSHATVDTEKIEPDYLGYISPEMAIAMGLATRIIPF